jgi:hypothetical protein
LAIFGVYLGRMITRSTLLALFCLAASSAPAVAGRGKPPVADRTRVERQQGPEFGPPPIRFEPRPDRERRIQDRQRNEPGLGLDLFIRDDDRRGDRR